MPPYFISNQNFTDLLLVWCGGKLERIQTKESIKIISESGLYQFLSMTLVNQSTLSELLYFYICKMKYCGHLCCLPRASPLVLGKAVSNYLLPVEVVNKKAPSNKDCTIQPLPLFVKQWIIRLSNILHLYLIPFCRKGGYLFNIYQHQLRICHCLYQQNLLSRYKFHSCSRMKATYNQKQRRGGKSGLISCRPQAPIFYVWC